MSEIRNELLADIITKAGGTATDTSNRNQLLMDWFSAAKGGDFVASLNGSDQYWQLNEDIVIAEGVDFVLEIKLNANVGSYYVYGSDTINNDYRLAFVGDSSPKAYGLRFNDTTLSDPRVQSEHTLKIVRVGTNIKIFVNDAEQASETVTAVALLLNRLGGKFDGTTSVNNLNGHVKEFKRYENGQLINHIRLTNKNQGAYQVAATTPLGDNLYTPNIIENPENAGAQWSYLGGGRWYLDGDGSLSALQFTLSAEQPVSGYLQFEIESISGGTLGCTADSIVAATFDSVGVKTYYYEDLTTQGNSIQFKRRGGSTKAVIKNIKHYDADGVLVASMVGYKDDVWIADPSPDNSAQYKSRNEILNMIAAAYGTSSNQNLSRNDYLNMILKNLGGSPENMTRNDILESIIERLQ